MKIDSKFLDGVARGALKEFGAPGLSIAVVANHRITSRAYGLADAESGEEMTVETAFNVASPTKGFTALAMAILREEGAFDWDHSVANLVPDLCGEFEDSRASITIRDLLSHQAGFGWHDPLWYNSPWDRSTVIAKSWQAGPVRGRRSGFQYCNLTYMLAGEIVARCSGMTYEEFVRRRIFGPLGLKSGHFSGDPSSVRRALARPHTFKDGELCALNQLDLSKANPACGLRMSARDLAVWITQFSKPSRCGIPARVFESVTEPQVTIGPKEGARFYALFGQPDWLQYAFGWFVRRYRGHRVLFHTGRLPGAGSHIAILPDLGVGVVALTNLTFACLAEAVTFALLEELVGGPKTDWISYYRGVSKELAAAAIVPPMPEVDPATVENAGRWAGHYFDDAYGHVEVRKGRTGLEFRWAHYRGDLLPAGDGKFRLVNLNCALLADGEGVEFQPEGDGVLLFLGRRFAAVSSVEARSKSTSRPVAASHAAHRRSNRKTSTVR